MAVELGIDHLVDAELIGQGGFSLVYAATDVRLGRRVAVKVIHGRLSERDLERFQQEGVIQRRVSAHPNVVTIHSTGQTPDGRPYLEMELVDGGTLADRLAERGRLAWPEAVDLLIPVAQALAHSHEQGILHRDVKPENILLHQGQPLLSDFGIAYLRGSSMTSSNLLTASWNHTAPETFSNRRESRSDIYSLASTLFTLINGNPPFFNPEDESLEPLVYRLLRQPAPRLAANLVPPELARLVQRCLAKDAAQRPQTAAELVEILTTIRRTAPSASTEPAGTPAPAPSPSPAVDAPPAVGPGAGSAITAPPADDGPAPIPASAPASSPGGPAHIPAPDPASAHDGPTDTPANPAPAHGGPTDTPADPGPPHDGPGEESGPLVEDGPEIRDTGGGFDPIPRPRRDLRPGTRPESARSSDRPGGGTESGQGPAGGSDPEPRRAGELVLVGGNGAATGLGGLGPAGEAGASAPRFRRSPPPAPSTGMELEPVPGPRFRATTLPVPVGPLQPEPEPGQAARRPGRGPGGRGRRRPGRMLLVVLALALVAALIAGFVLRSRSGGTTATEGATGTAAAGDTTASTTSAAGGGAAEPAPATSASPAPAFLGGANGPVATLPTGSLTLRGHEGEVLTVAALGDGRLASGGRDGTVRVWAPARPDEPPLVLRGHSGPVRAVAALPGNRLASGADDGTVRIWDLDPASATSTGTGTTTGTTDSSGGAGTPADPVVIRGTETSGREALLVLPGGKLAAGCADGVIRVWDLARPDGPATSYRHHTDAVRALALLADGRIASAGDDRTVQIWDPARPAVKPLVLKGHTAPVWSLAPLPDGRLASGDGSGAAPGTIRVWDLKLTSAKPLVLNGTGIQRSLLALPDGRLVAADAAGSLRIWDLRTAANGPGNSASNGTGTGTGPVLTIPDQPDGPLAAALLNDGRVATAEPDGTVRVRPLPTT